MKTRGKQAELMRQRGFVTVKEIATKLGITKTTVYRWVEQGKVAEERIGAARYISLSSLAQHLGPTARQMLEAP